MTDVLRDEPRGGGDVFNPECPARSVLDLLAEKWTLLIVHALSERTMRTGELRRRVLGISEKMLIQSLRRLEDSGLVLRTSYPEVPPRVEYQLSPLGISLSNAVKTLDRWVEENAEAISQGRGVLSSRDRA